MTRASNAALSILLAILAFGLYSTMDMLIKSLSGRFPLPQLIFAIGLFVLLPAAGLVAQAGGRHVLQTRRLRLHLLRGGIGLGGAFCSFFAYSRMPLADVYAIAFSAPLFVTALSVPLLREHVGPRRWSAVTVGFIGVLIMLRPGMGLIGPGTFAAFGGALGYTGSVLILSRMRHTETLAAQLLYPTLVTVTGSGLLLPFVFVRPNGRELLLFAAMGLCAALAQIALINAFRRVTVAVVAPFQYTQMLWGIFYGYLFWADRPDRWTLIGAAIVIASGLYILYRETIRHPGVTTAATGSTGIGEPMLPDDTIDPGNPSAEPRP